jgi:hypothetical protein
MPFVSTPRATSIHREQGLARAEPGAPGPDTSAERTGL